MACLKKVFTIRLLKHGAKFSSILVNNAKVVAGKLDGCKFLYSTFVSRWNEPWWHRGSSDLGFF